MMIPLHSFLLYPSMHMYNYVRIYTQHIINICFYTHEVAHQSGSFLLVQSIQASIFFVRCFHIHNGLGYCQS